MKKCRRVLDEEEEDIKEVDSKPPDLSTWPWQDVPLAEVCQCATSFGEMHCPVDGDPSECEPDPK